MNIILKHLILILNMNNDDSDFENNFEEDKENIEDITQDIKNSINEYVHFYHAPYCGKFSRAC